MLKRIKIQNKIYRGFLIEQIDKLDFKRILFLWLLIIIFFGLIYQYATTDQQFLFHAIEEKRVDQLEDFIYFSFVTAIAAGFSGIYPFEDFRIIAIIEAVFGLLLLALLTSKLVSIKQDAILSELYEFSFSEKISKLRSELLLFRQHINRLLTKGEENVLKKGDINEIESQVTAFEHALTEAFMLINRSRDNQFIKKIDQINSEIIFNSILHSFEKLYEVMIVFDNHKVEWKSESTKKHIIKCISLNEDIFTKAEKILLKETLMSLNIRKEKIILNIKNKIVE